MSRDRQTVLVLAWLGPLAGVGAAMWSSNFVVAVVTWAALTTAIILSPPGRSLWRRLEDEREANPTATSLFFNTPVRRQLDGDASLDVKRASQSSQPPLAIERDPAMG